MVSEAGIGADEIVGTPHTQFIGVAVTGIGPQAHGGGTGTGTGSYTIFSTTLGGGLFGVS
jgi:hypothetical protein